MPNPITVVIADDHAIFRQALRLTLTHRAKGMTVAGEAENGEQALEVVRAHQPDILLLDLGMPKKTIRDLLEEVRIASPKTRVIILTGFADPDSVALVARTGAKGFVLKSGPLEPLLEAIQHVARGEAWADPMLSVTSHREFLRFAGGEGEGDAQPDPLLRSLSQRELEVVKLVAEGLSNRDIAAKLSISEKTVTSHLNHVFDKLGVASRLQAALVYNKLARGPQA
jgi:DNA-binding NarL/FixJ family response regulator